MITKITIKKSLMMFAIFVVMVIGLSSALSQEQKDPLEKSLQAINSLSEMIIHKEKVPKGWKQLNSRVIRTNLDKDLSGIVNVTIQLCQGRINDTKYQSFQIGDESFNVDIFWVEEGLDKLMKILEEHIHPPEKQSEDPKEKINWVQQKYEKTLLVISTSDTNLQKQILSEYTKLWFGLIETKAAKSIKDKKEDIALSYFKIALPEAVDLGRAYMKFANTYLYELNGPTESISNYEKCLTYANKVKFTNQELGEIHKGIGLGSIETSDFKKAEKSFHKSYEIAQKNKDDKLIGESCYYLACIYAKIKDKEKTYKYLEICFKLNREWVKSVIDNSAFKELQKEDRFNNLIKQYGND